jgi:hypothetical protein
VNTLIEVLLALLLAALFVGYVVVFAVTWRMIVEARRWLRRYRATRRFFKSIERFRRDFK